MSNAILIPAGSIFEDPMPLPDATDSANAEIMVAALDKDRWSSVEIYNLVQAHENLKLELEEARKEYAEKLQELSASQDASAPAQAQVDELSTNLSELTAKYKKVKMYYFEKVAREEALVAEVAGHVKQAEALAEQIETHAKQAEYHESVKTQCMDVEKQYSLKCQELDQLRESKPPEEKEHLELRQKYQKVKRYYFEQKAQLEEDAKKKMRLEDVIVELTGTTQLEVELLTKPTEDGFTYVDNESEFLVKHYSQIQHLRHLAPNAPSVDECPICSPKLGTDASETQQPDRSSLAASDSSMTLNGEDYEWNWGTGAWRKKQFSQHELGYQPPTSPATSL